MGRGRQKAKHMKVARKLKYTTVDTDLGALQRELGGHDQQTSPVFDDSDDESKYWDDSATAQGGAADDHLDDPFEDRWA